MATVDNIYSCGVPECSDLARKDLEISLTFQGETHTRYLCLEHGAYMENHSRSRILSNGLRGELGGYPL